jgi:hypothetical protein
MSHNHAQRMSEHEIYLIAELNLCCCFMLSIWTFVELNGGEPRPCSMTASLPKHKLSYNNNLTLHATALSSSSSICVRDCTLTRHQNNQHGMVTGVSGK